MEDGAIKTQTAQPLTEGSDAAPTEEGEQQLKGLGVRMGAISKGQQTRQRLVFSHTRGEGAFPMLTREHCQ